MGYKSRKPTPNEPPIETTEKNKWVREALTDFADEVVLLLQEEARRCAGCNRAALLVYLKNGKCPDCRGENVTPNLHRGRQRQSYTSGMASGEAGDAD